MLLYRTLVYVDGEASNTSYEDSEGKNRTSFNIVQRKWLAGLPGCQPTFFLCAGDFDADL